MLDAESTLSAGTDTAPPRPGWRPRRSPEACSPAARPDSPEDEDDLAPVRRAIDQSVHASVARMTAGFSPAALAEAWFDWAIHAAFSPGKQATLVVKLLRKQVRLAQFVARSAVLQGHAAPWRSVFKIHPLADTDVTFVLASGGHNAGIVAPPGRPQAHHRIRTTRATDHYRDPDTWRAQTPQSDGSWWPAWTAWLAERSGPPAPPPAMGAPASGYVVLGDAPGAYVLDGAGFR